MKPRSILQALVRVIADEADVNPEFDAKLREVLQLIGEGKSVATPRRRRRSPAVLDPVLVARTGEAQLREELRALNIEQLKDIVAQYSMDPNKLVMKWKTHARIVEQIVEVSMQRATKGDAFRVSK